jgi:hypothetical protein
MGAYDFNFDVPPGERYQPSPERVAAWERIMPEDNFAFAPRADDRAAWSRWQKDPIGQQLLEQARQYVLDGYPDYNNATYLDCLDREDLTKINQVLPIARRRQIVFLMAEAIYDKGEFIDVIGDDFDRLTQVDSWVHPNNDLERRIINRETYEIDLVTAHYTASLSQTIFILGDRLPAALQERIRAELNLRSFEPLRRRLESGKDVYWWVDVTHNWNSVCLACMVQGAAAILPAADRAWWFAAGEMLVKNFRESFNNDGFCTEGVAYWGYGVAHYIIVSEMFRLATGGAVDLFDEPKASRIMLFPERSEIEPGLFPTFADCRIGTEPLFWARHWLANRQSKAAATTTPLANAPDPFDGMNFGSIAYLSLWMFQTVAPRQPRATIRPPALRNWFEDSSLMIARPGADTGRRFSATFLGGNNGVNHNHNDLGTFTVCLDGKALIVDPGMETYSFRTFSVDRYDSQLLNSYGHPVPRVAGRLQEVGPEWHTKVVETEFTDEVDRVVLNLRRAYDVPTLRRLDREFVYDRRGDGSLTITDHVEFSDPEAFESALISFGTCEIDGNRLIFRDGETVINAEVQIEGADLIYDRDTINQPPHPIRIGLRCAGPVMAASIRVSFMPGV